MLLPAQLFKRRPDSHKGDFGHVLVLAGSSRFTGAACLSVNAAMRSGAGLVTLGIPKSLHPIVASKLTEGMTLPLPETQSQSLSEEAFREIRVFLKRVNCLLLGPGISREASTQLLVRHLLLKVRDKSVVVDADGLNALVEHLDILKSSNNRMVLTPHPGELARLMDLPVSQIQKNRKEVAKAFTQRYNITLILKGNNTLVASKEEGIYVNRTGNPGMATAGSGDVLSGIIAAFLAQGLDIYQAAKAAVYIHGLAGDLAAKDKTEISLIASDIIDYLPAAFKKARGKS